MIDPIADAHESTSLVNGCAFVQQITVQQVATSPHI